MLDVQEKTLVQGESHGLTVIAPMRSLCLPIVTLSHSTHATQLSHFLIRHLGLTGAGGGFESFPVALHHNARSNGTMVLTALFNSPGVKGLELYQLSP